MKLPIYMDNHATTPVDPRVLDAMLPYFQADFGNAASRNHVFGWRAEAGAEEGREQVARLIGANEKEIIITAVTEHKAVLDSCKALERRGLRVTYLPVDNEGRVDPADVEKAITDRTILITIMLANNEVGTVHPVAEIGRIAHEKGVLFHCDAVQGVGKIPVSVEQMNIDLLSLTAHKIYGPKGVGALYVRRKNPRVRLTPLIDGGGHERGMRSGTLNVPGIVGLGKACALALEEMPTESKQILALRERLRKRLDSELEAVYLNGSLEHRLPGNLNVSFAYVEGESLLMGLKDVAVSSGSACTSASLEPSYVLRALGVGEDLAHTSIRFGIGRFNTEEEVDYVAALVIENVKRLREMSPLYEMVKEGIDLKSVSWVSGE
jgi:cysteine desulfurase